MKNLASFATALILLIGIPAPNTFAADNTNDNHVVTISILEVALLDLENTGSIELEPSKPTEAGAALSFASVSNSDAWLNYSSIVASGKSRNVTVKLESNNLPTGLVLKVKAAGDAGQGNGTMGSASASAISLSATGSGQNLVTGIGSCYTGDGETKGHNLTYSLELASEADYKNLVQGETDVTIIYTLTDDL